MIPGSLEGLDISISDMWKEHRKRIKALSKHSFAGWILQTIKERSPPLIWVRCSITIFQNEVSIHY